MNTASGTALETKLAQLRAELADLAFVLESQGRLDAADVAMSIRARVGELCETPPPAGPDAFYADSAGVSRSGHYAE